ncbi:MAG TPA: thiamine pyrophosphate-dependent enzyme [Candidatus Limnocylindrales bacterium]
MTDDSRSTGVAAERPVDEPSADNLTTASDASTTGPDEPVAVAEVPTADLDGHAPLPDESDSGHDELVPPSAPPTTIAGLIAATLRAAGVRSAFTVPGESFLPLIDALVDVGIRVVATRHENGAAFMASAQAQLTGRPSACLATRAVGAANLAVGIHAARADSSPLIAIVGGVERRLAGREAFQEADLPGSIGRLAAWSGTIDDSSTAAAVLAEGLGQAILGRPGPVLFAVPEDVLDEAPPPETRVEAPRPSAARPADGDVRAVLNLLAGAERPVILAGGGVLRARTSTDLARLAELLHVPVIAAWRRGDVIPNENPLYLGMTGYGAPSVVRERLERADAILVLGCRLNEPASYGYQVPRPGQRWVHVDLSPRTDEGTGLPPPELAIRADARAFIRAAIVRLRSGVLEASLVDARRAANDADRAAWDAATTVDEAPWDGPGVHPGRIITTLRRVLPDDAVVTTDAGNFAGWLARGFRFRRPGTFLGPTSGAMGYGFPAAIGAALVHRDRAVVSVSGDGGFAMSMAELETAVREGLRVVALVFDNERYGTIRMHQERDGRQPVATDLGPFDFTAVARACGARGVRVESDAGFESALRQALAAADRPTVIQLTLDRRWVSVDDHP